MQLDHPNVPRLQEYFVDESNIYIIYEKIDGEELFTHLLGVENYIRENFPSIFHQLLLILEYCHRKGYAHLNIVPDNILIANKNGTYLLKLVGFSQAYEFKERRRFEDENFSVPRTQTRITVLIC